MRIWRITRRAVLVFSQRSTSMDFKAALQTQPPRSPATPFFFVIPFVTHVFDHTHICERALLHTEFAMASVRDFAHRFPVRCGKKSYQHGCRTAQVLSGHHGLKSQGFPKVRSKKLASSSFMVFYLQGPVGINFMDILHLGNKLLVPSPTL